MHPDFYGLHAGLEAGSHIPIELGLYCHHEIAFFPNLAVLPFSAVLPAKGHVATEFSLAPLGWQKEPQEYLVSAGY
jgi:hypothetical protein